MLCLPSPWISFLRKPIGLCNCSGRTGASPQTVLNTPPTRTPSFPRKPAGNLPAQAVVLHFIISKGCDDLLHFHGSMFRVHDQSVCLLLQSRW